MGIAAEAAQMEQGNGIAALSDRLLDAIWFIGPLDRSQERLAAFHDEPILGPPTGVDGARQVNQALRRSVVHPVSSCG